MRHYLTKLSRMKTPIQKVVEAIREEVTLSMETEMHSSISRVVQMLERIADRLERAEAAEKPTGNLATYAIAELDALGGDPEGAHSDADKILLRFLHDTGYSEVAFAFERAYNRVGFWYA